MWLNPQETADLVTFTDEILNGKLNFLCSVKRPISKIPRLLMFGFKPENCEKVWKISTRFLNRSQSSRKNVKSSTYIVNKKQWSKISIPLIWLKILRSCLPIWDQVFMNGLNKISGRHPLKNLKRYG